MKRFDSPLVQLGLLFFLSAPCLFLAWNYQRNPLDAEILVGQRLLIHGEARDYRIVIPHTASIKMPLVLAFHGMGDSSESMASYSGLDQLASDKGFLLVYPSAQKNLWSTKSPATNPDVEFFDRLLTILAKQHEIDQGRIYCIGMSNGASFVQLLANARPGKIAACVAHSGPIFRNRGATKNSCPILLIAGENDLAFHPMKADAESYRSRSHLVKFISVPELGHEWSKSHNDEIWSFLSQYSTQTN